MEANKDKMASIAFPALGCGSLRYDPRDLVGCFVNAQQACGQQLQVQCVQINICKKRMAFKPFRDGGPGKTCL